MLQPSMGISTGVAESNKEDHDVGLERNLHLVSAWQQVCTIFLFGAHGQDLCFKSSWKKCMVVAGGGSDGCEHGWG